MTESSPNMTEDLSARPTPRKNRKQGALIALLFLGSLGVAFLMYYGLDWAPGADAAHGRLIHPAKPLEHFEGTRLEGGGFGLSDLKGQWNMVFVHTGACAEACQETLYRLRQVRLTFGRDMPRLNRVLLLGSTTDAHGVREVLEAHPDLDAVRAGAGLIGTLEDAAGGAVENGVLIVDPLGNLMMRYSSDFELKGLQGDLKRLLKYSHIG